MTRLALFDCDGTLVDGQANHCLAMEAAFTEQGLELLPRDIVRRVIGLSLFESMRLLVPSGEDDLHHAMVAGYKKAFIAMRGRAEIEEPLYDGIGDLLHRLHKDGWQLGVATGKSDRGLTHCLDHHRIKQLFVSLQTADRHPSKPHPSMVFQAMADAGVEAGRTVMIGDTSFDMEMGRAAQCRTIGVSWGYHSPDELLQSGAEQVAYSMAELSAILEEMA
ncbi:HAD-IA family hydrolase [Sphingorhabdus arenilitoris]|uniref:HAD-IA family hydrolase n=1 Tax=Sphingorhabdus arenilitoris TaxID=1490041 RepID=A0ABV8RBQ0_9SPHN